MAVQKYNIKEELLDADNRLTGSLSLLGMTSLTQPAYNNAMRSNMFTSHLNQYVNLKKSEFPGFFTNAENVVGKHSSGYKQTKNDTVVYRKISKFSDITPNEYVYHLFLYDKKRNKYSVVTRQTTENLGEVFGYDYDNSVIDAYEEGDKVDKGTVLYRSTSYDEHMNYGYGKNIPVHYTLDPDTSEDAAVCSETLAREMSSIEVETVSFGVNDNDFLLNLKGNSENYKPLPEIGEWSEDILAAIRVLYNNQLLSDFKDSNLNKISETDRLLYMTGELIDIDIYCNNPEIENNPFNEQICKYLDNQTRYYTEINDLCDEIKASGAKYTHELDYLHKRSKEFLNHETKWRENNGSQPSNLVISLTVKHDSPLRKGQKITGRFGNKSVISRVRPDDEMPYYYDDNCNKVIIHLLLNALSIINRTTAYPLYEINMSFITNKIRARMVGMKTLKEKEELVFDIINMLNEEQYKKMYATYSALSTKEKEEYIQDIIDDRLYIHQAPLWEVDYIFHRINRIHQKYEWMTPYNMYIKKWGHELKTLNTVYFGEMYMLKLKQTSKKGFSVRGTGSINAKGLPERSYKNKSHTEQYSSTPIRFGEYESLNFLIGMAPEDIAIFHMMYRTSIKGRRELAESLLTSDGVVNISKSFTSRAAEIFAVILKSLGVRIDFVNEDSELYELDDKSLTVHEYKGKTHMCTEYEFFKMKRRDEIEEEILAKHPVIDKHELQELIDKELESRIFLMGDSK